MEVNVLQPGNILQCSTDGGQGSAGLQQGVTVLLELQCITDGGQGRAGLLQHTVLRIMNLVGPRGYHRAIRALGIVPSHPPVVNGAGAANGAGTL